MYHTHRSNGRVGSLALGEIWLCTCLLLLRTLLTFSVTLFDLRESSYNSRHAIRQHIREKHAAVHCDAVFALTGIYDSYTWNTHRLDSRTAYIFLMQRKGMANAVAS